MIGKRIDRRIVRTRNLLRESLLGLITEKRYDEITVENITERADLGRATFYLHYHDKTELLLESIDVIAEDLIGEASKAGFIPGTNPFKSIPVTAENQTAAILLVFNYAQKNAKLWRVILRGDGMTEASLRIREIIGKISGTFFFEQWKVFVPGSEPKLPAEIIGNYFASALMGFLTWWLEDGTRYPAERMADMFRNLFFQGAYQAAGLPFIKES